MVPYQDQNVGNHNLWFLIKIKRLGTTTRLISNVPKAIKLYSFLFNFRFTHRKRNKIILCPKRRFKYVFLIFDQRKWQLQPCVIAKPPCQKSHQSTISQSKHYLILDMSRPLVIGDLLQEYTALIIWIRIYWSQLLPGGALIREGVKITWYRCIFLEVNTPILENMLTLQACPKK